MTNVNNTPTAEVTAPVVKAPTKKSLAKAIFDEKLAERNQSLFATNREFRKAVVTKIMAELNAPFPSACAMYNVAMKASGVTIGRDPKKAKRVTSGVRGRPLGSHNKAKAVVAVAPTSEAIVPVVEAAEPVTI